MLAWLCASVWAGYGGDIGAVALGSSSDGGDAAAATAAGRVLVLHIFCLHFIL